MKNTKTIYSSIMAFLILILIIAIIYVYNNQNKLKVLTASDLQKVGINISNSPTKNQNSNLDLGKVSEAYNQNNFNLANKILDQKLNNDKKNITLLLLKATTLAEEASLTFKEKELGDSALDYINQALAIDPQNLDALTLKGYVYEIQQDYTSANKYYDKALAINPKYVNTLTQKAHVYDLQGDLKDSEVYYKKAIDSNPDYLKANLGLARIYLLQGENDKAKILLNKVVDSSQNIREKAEAYYSLGNISETKTYNSVAEKYYQQAIQTDPTLALSYVGLGKEEFFNGKVPESLSDLSKALQINPHQTSAALQLAVEYYSLGQINTSKQILIKVLEDIKNDISLNASSKAVTFGVATSLLKIIK